MSRQEEDFRKQAEQFADETRETPEDKFQTRHDYLAGCEYGFKYALTKLGWRPASELPIIPEGKFSVSVIAYCNTPSGIYAPVEIAYTRTRGWQYESVKWWCYPPKND